MEFCDPEASSFKPGRRENTGEQEGARNPSGRTSGAQGLQGSLRTASEPETPEGKGAGPVRRHPWEPSQRLSCSGTQWLLRQIRPHGYWQRRGTATARSPSIRAPCVPAEGASTVVAGMSTASDSELGEGLTVGFQQAKAGNAGERGEADGCAWKMSGVRSTRPAAAFGMHHQTGSRVHSVHFGIAPAFILCQ